MDKTYKAIIIDDEPRARALLSGLLSDVAEDITVVAESEDLPNGVKAIRKLNPDIVFLDIEMPGHSGLELLDFFSEDEVQFEIIFTTAYSNYAVRAFKLSAIDYLMKPIEEDGLCDAVARFRRKDRNRLRHLDLATLRENLKGDKDQRIAVPSGNSIKFIDPAEIVFLRADGSYTELFFADGTQLVVSRTLKNFEDIFVHNTRFYRCHKSYMVNTTFIKEYVKSNGGYLLMQGNHEVSVSPDRAEVILKLPDFVKR